MEIVRCGSGKQKELRAAAQQSVGSRSVFEDVVRHVTQKLAAQAS
jgi:hypothetical protein